MVVNTSFGNRGKRRDMERTKPKSIGRSSDHHRDMMSFPNLVGSALIGGLLVLVYIYKRRQENRKSQSLTKDFKRDHVYLHQIGKGPYAPSLTPFAIKFETFLRMTKTPYTNVHDKQRGPKGKVPWMEYNDVTMADSQLCIEYLTDERGIKLNDILTDEQKGTGKAVQRMVDEHTYWIMVHYRWVLDKEKAMMKLANWKWLSIQVVSYLGKKQTYYQGVGRHSPEEIDRIFRRDLQALSDILGEKDYLFGDSPTEADCCAFGQLSQFIWHLPHTDTSTIIKNDFRSLYQYCLRIKSTYWPDWDECIMFPSGVSDLKD